jgi:hypothetical protein
MDYITMSTDIIRFCDQHSLQDITLLGHSMYLEFHWSRGFRVDIHVGVAKLQ